MADVELKKAEDKSKPDESKQEEKPVPLTPLQEVKANVTLIDRAVANLEPRFTHRVLRTLTSLRKKLDENIIRNAIDELYLRGMYSEYTVARELSYIWIADNPTKRSLLAWLPEPAMDVDAVSSKPAFTNSVQDPSPESEAYLRLLIIHRLLSSPGTYEKALALAQETVEKIQASNRRTMDPIAAKVWYAVERAFELGASLADARPSVLLQLPSGVCG